MSNSEIRFVHHNDIDFQKWDQCINQSPFAIAYAKSWYLDRICTHWDALICGDYHSVMPLVNNRKYGISYIYQPFFTQQLGIFSPENNNSELISRFLDAIPKQYRLTDMNLNLGNTPKTTEFQCKEMTTYHLNLEQEIDVLRNAYTTNTQRNIQKAIQQKVRIKPVSDVQLFLQFTAENLSLKSPEIKKTHYSALEKVIQYALANQSGEILGAWDAGSNLIASVFFVQTNQTAIYLAATSNQSGIEKKAMFLLIDSFIGQNSGKVMILDFEGSIIPGIARFYAGFGAVAKTYYSLHKNQLPKILRWIKK